MEEKKGVEKEDNYKFLGGRENSRVLNGDLKKGGIWEKGYS